jgi:hypothetical protein
LDNLDSLLKRNKEFAAQQAAAGTLMPSLPAELPNSASFDYTRANEKRKLTTTPDNNYLALASVSV